MKLKRLILISIMLPFISFFYASSDIATTPSLADIHAAISNLTQTESVLAKLLATAINSPAIPVEAEERPAISAASKEMPAIPEPITEDFKVSSTEKSQADVRNKTISDKLASEKEVNINVQDAVVKEYNSHPNPIFYNDTRTTIRIQTLIDGQLVGAPVLIDYTPTAPYNFKQITTPIAAGQVVSYSITMPQAPQYPALNFNYDAKYRHGYQINTKGQSIIIGARLTKPYVITPLSTTFYNLSSQTIRVQPLINGKNVGAPVDIDYINTYPFSSRTVTASAMRDQTLSYNITMPKVSSYAAVNVPYDAKNDNVGYQVNADAQVLIVKALTKSSYTYKNTTNIPLIITMTINNKTHTQQIDSGKEYTQIASPLTPVKLDAHANLGAIYEQYNPKMAYTLAIDKQAQKLVLYPTSGQEKVLTNNSGWRILIDALLSDDSHDYKTINNGSQYTPLQSCTYITAIPLIPNNSSDDFAKSCSIINKKGQLFFQF